jgi:hypothetical protein
MWLWTLKASDTNVTDGEPPEDDTGGGEEGSSKKDLDGFILEFDAARKIAQSLGAHLETLETLVQIEGKTARLLPVSERARSLFGERAGKALPLRKRRVPQMELFKIIDGAADGVEEPTDSKVEQIGATTLDRVHQSMILFAGGRTEALKRFLVEDGAGNSTRFWTLAQALSALYPAGTDEKRWVDGVLVRKKGLGF